jgi:hypothetical protein
MLVFERAADFGVIFPNSNNIGDFDPEIGWRFKYSDDLNRRCA